MSQLLEQLKTIIESLEADGCEGCAFEDREEWEEPCRRCKRNHQDYWRKGEDVDNDGE